MAEETCSANAEELIKRAQKACSIASPAEAEAELRKVVKEASCHKEDKRVVDAIIHASLSHGLSHLVDELRKEGFSGVFLVQTDRNV